MEHKHTCPHCKATVKFDLHIIAAGDHDDHEAVICNACADARSEEARPNG